MYMTLRAVVGDVPESIEIGRPALPVLSQFARGVVTPPPRQKLSKPAAAFSAGRDKSSCRKNQISNRKRPPASPELRLFDVFLKLRFANPVVRALKIGNHNNKTKPDRAKQNTKK
jgi:hypothetical protein